MCTVVARLCVKFQATVGAAQHPMNCATLEVMRSFLLPTRTTGRTAHSHTHRILTCDCCCGKTWRLPHCFGNIMRLPNSYGNIRRLPHCCGNIRRLPHCCGNIRRLPHRCGNTRRLPHCCGNTRRLPYCCGTKRRLLQRRAVQ